MFGFVSLEARVPSDYPLRPMRAMVARALESISSDFSEIDSTRGRPTSRRRRTSWCDSAAWPPPPHEALRGVERRHAPSSRAARPGAVTAHVNVRRAGLGARCIMRPARAPSGFRAWGGHRTRRPARQTTAFIRGLLAHPRRFSPGRAMLRDSASPRPSHIPALRAAPRRRRFPKRGPRVRRVRDRRRRRGCGSGRG